MEQLSSDDFEMINNEATNDGAENDGEIWCNNLSLIQLRSMMIHCRPRWDDVSIANVSRA